MNCVWNSMECFHINHRFMVEWYSMELGQHTLNSHRKSWIFIQYSIKFHGAFSVPRSSVEFHGTLHFSKRGQWNSIQFDIWRNRISKCWFLVFGICQWQLDVIDHTMIFQNTLLSGIILYIKLCMCCADSTNIAYFTKTYTRKYCRHLPST